VAVELCQSFCRENSPSSLEPISAITARAALSTAHPCRIILSVPTARILPIVLLAFALAGCNRNQPAVLCAPLSTATLVRVAQKGSGQTRQFDIDNHYQLQSLVEFANGRRQGFSARRKGLPAPIASATFFNGSQRLLTFSAGANFFSMSCSGYTGVQEANRVQIAEFERLLKQQP